MATTAQIVQFLLSPLAASGITLSGGQAFFFAAGTSTPKDIWIDRNKSTLAANPYTLDSNGTAQIYADGIYRVVVKDSNGVTRYDRDYLNFADNGADITDLDAAVAARTFRYVTDYADLAAAVAAIGSTPATLAFRTDQVLTANLTIPSTLELLPLDGAVIYYGAYTFTYSGSTARWPIAQVLSGSGTVALAHQSYPEWFGTAVNSFNKAAAALPNGGILRLAAADYEIDQTADLPSNLVIQGVGRKSRIFTTYGSWQNGLNMLMATSKQNITVSGVYVQNSHYGDAFPPGGTMTGMGVNVLFCDCDNVTVEDCYLSGGGGYIDSNDQGIAPIYFSKCRGFKASRNTIFDSQNGIIVDNWYATGEKSKGGIISDNEIYNIAGRGIGVDLNGGDTGTVAITGNSIRQYAWSGINTSNSNSVTITGNTINGTATGRTQGNPAQLAWNGRYGIYINEISVTPSTGIVISSNTISNILYTPIRVYATSSLSITGNAIHSYTGDSSVAAAGILIYSNDASVPISRVSICSNVIAAAPATGATVDGIVLDMFVDAIAIDSVKIADNVITGVNNRGINKKFIGTNAATNNVNISVTGNTVKTNASGAGTGIYINGISGGVIANNVTYQCAVGVQVSNSYNTTFDNKSHYDTVGLRLVNSTAPLIRGSFANSTTALDFSGTNTIGDATQAVYDGVTNVKSRTSTGARVLRRVTSIPSVGVAPYLDDTGDRAVNVSATVGQPKAWVYTGSAWASEGNL